MRQALLLALLLPGIASAETFSGKVIGVANGDTITVLHNKKPVKIRLHRVDCPEKRQPFGQKAKQFTSKMVFGKVVRVRVNAIAKHPVLLWSHAGERHMGRIHSRSSHNRQTLTRTDPAGQPQDWSV